MWEAGVSFVAAQIVLAIFVWSFTGRKTGKPTKTFPGGARVMVLGAFVLVGTEILALGVLGQKAWASVYFHAAEARRHPYSGAGGAVCLLFPVSRVRTENLEPYIPTRSTKETRTTSAWIRPTTWTRATTSCLANWCMPVNREIQLLMHAKDVGHSFYVRELRIQQDFVPGLDLSVHFTATQIGKYEIVCYATLRSRSLQHEGISERYVRTGLRELAKAAGEPVGARFPHGARIIRGRRRRFRSEVIQWKKLRYNRLTYTRHREGFIRKYVFSLDHKVIGKQYYALALVAVFTGMILSWLMRIHMVWPNAKIPLLEHLSSVGAPGGIITPEYYLSLMTMHGTLMVFFVLTNAPFAAFGNYFLPIQIGAEDMAFPRFNMMSFWITFVAWVVLMLAFCYSGWASHRRMDQLRSAECGWQRRRTGHAVGHEPVGVVDRHILYRVAAGRAQFHSHDAGFACQGHDIDAHAAVYLGVVHHVVHRVTGVRGAAASLHSVDPGSTCRNKLLHTRGIGDQ